MVPFVNAIMFVELWGGLGCKLLFAYHVFSLVLYYDHCFSVLLGFFKPCIKLYLIDNLNALKQLVFFSIILRLLFVKSYAVIAIIRINPWHIDCSFARERPSHKKYIVTIRGHAPLYLDICVLDLLVFRLLLSSICLMLAIILSPSDRLNPNVPKIIFIQR